MGARHSQGSTQGVKESNRLHMPSARTWQVIFEKASAGGRHKSSTGISDFLGPELDAESNWDQRIFLKDFFCFLFLFGNWLRSRFGVREVQQIISNQWTGPSWSWIIPCHLCALWLKVMAKSGQSPVLEPSDLDKDVHPSCTWHDRSLAEGSCDFHSSKLLWFGAAQFSCDVYGLYARPEGGTLVRCLLIICKATEGGRRKAWSDGWNSATVVFSILFLPTQWNTSPPCMI